MAYSTIDDPTIYFNTLLWTGDGVNGRSLTGVGHQPDWVWSKCRSHVVDHGLQDSVRGVGKVFHSNSTTAEGTDNWITSLNSDGFTLSNSNEVNQDTRTFVAWNWKKTATAGFDIVSYTGDGAEGRNISHSLSAVPAMMLVKNRDASVKWAVYHQKNTAAPETDHLILSSTDATADDDSTWDDTAPTSSVFRVKGSSATNGDGVKYIAYLFAEKQGYSKFGNWTGNGNADGPFCFTGFKPAWIMFKKTDAAGDWMIKDNKRGGTSAGENFGQMNPNQLQYAAANRNYAETYASGYSMDILSNGFKVRGTDSGMNTSGSNYIYMAFAESSFVNSNGIPNNAR